MVRIGRRRRSWSWSEKRQMVAETEVAGASVSIVARRHDINANLLFKWRKEIEDEHRKSGGAQASEFLPIGIVGQGGDNGQALLTTIASASEHRTRSGTAAPSRDLIDRPGVMEFELACGVKIRADSTVDEQAFGRVLAALRRYR